MQFHIWSHSRQSVCNCDARLAERNNRSKYFLKELSVRYRTEEHCCRPLVLRMNRSTSFMMSDSRSLPVNIDYDINRIASDE